MAIAHRIDRPFTTRAAFVYPAPSRGCHEERTSSRPRAPITKPTVGGPIRTDPTMTSFQTSACAAIHSEIWR